MKKTLKEIFEQYQIYNDKGQLVPLMESELGKELFGEVNELNKSDVKSSVCVHNWVGRYLKTKWIVSCKICGEVKAN